MKNNTEVGLHENKHKKKINMNLFFKNPRLKIFPFVEKITGKKLSGNVLDVGAGNGYAGIWLAKNRDTKVTLLECTKEATQNTIPYFAKHFDVLSSCQIQKGSFNDLSAFEGKFDFIICFGALHHSSNLLKVMDNIMCALKPGGILIANEPFTKNNIDNKVFNYIYNSEESFAGKIIRHGDRDDHFYRECEWLTAIHHSGLNIIKLHDVSRLLYQKNLRSFLSRFLLHIKRYFKIAEINQIVSFSEMRGQKLKPKNMLLLCQKPMLNDPPPHRWFSGKNK
jgi:2-polyprenyl-3-methyl-5-hydroxy-6-metoxy-1,4-benzoquinol methylase